MTLKIQKTDPVMIVLLTLAVTFLFLPAAAEPANDNKGFVILSGALFSSSDSNYRALYGGSTFMPEIKAGYMVYRKFYAWASFACFSGKGTLPEVEEEITIKRQLISLGGGYRHRLTTRLDLRGELGLLYAAFQETAFTETYKGSGLGWKLGVALDYAFWKSFFLTLNAGFSGASHTAEPGKLKLGGFQAGIGVGITL